MRKVAQILLLLLVALSLSHCQSLKRPAAIDGRVTITSLADAATLIPLAAEERIEKMVLSAPDSEFGNPLPTALSPSALNEVMFAAAQKYPQQFIPFPILYLFAEDRLIALNTLIASGAKGITLRHDGRPELAIDDPSLEPVYTQIAAHRLPVLLSINPQTEIAALDRLLNAHPALTVICSHLCGLTFNLDRVSSLLAAHPNFYTDFSFSESELEKNILKFSQNPASLRSLLLKYPTRFIFATGTQATTAALADRTKLPGIFIGYRRLFEKAHYDFPLLAHRWKNRGIRLAADGGLNGLFLPLDILAKLYSGNVNHLIH